MDHIEQAKQRALKLLPSGGGYFSSALPARFNLATQLMILEKLDAQNETLENIWRMLQVLDAKIGGMDRPAGAALPAQEKETPADRSVLNITNKDGGSPAATGPRLVDKLCATVGCGEMMYQVPISRKYCDKCKGAK